MNIGELDRRLLNDFQRGFPLSPTPFADLARELGIAEDEVLARLAALKAEGAVSRVGAVLRPHAVGVSTLAAMAVPPERLEAVAALVSAYDEINHNYEREHDMNLWFVACAADGERLTQVLDEISERSGLAVYPFPMIEDYHINLGFDLRWA